MDRSAQDRFRKARELMSEASELLDTLKLPELARQRDGWPVGHPAFDWARKMDVVRSSLEEALDFHGKAADQAEKGSVPRMVRLDDWEVTDPIEAASDGAAAFELLSEVSEKVAG